MVKTAEQWVSEIPLLTESLVVAIQDDATATLRTRLAEVEADNAAMIQVIECAGSHDHSDGDEKDCVLCAAVNSVLDHPHPGKSLLERQKEAEWLLLHSNDLPKPDGWFDRRDALLNPKPQ